MQNRNLLTHVTKKTRGRCTSQSLVLKLYQLYHFLALLYIGFIYSKLSPHGNKMPCILPANQQEWKKNVSFLIVAAKVLGRGVSLAYLGLHAHSLTNHMSKEMEYSDWTDLEQGNGNIFNQDIGTKSGWGMVSPKLNQGAASRKRWSKYQAGKNSRFPIPYM